MPLTHMPILFFVSHESERAGRPTSVPMELLDAHTAAVNHNNKTLEQIAQDGGLFPVDMLAVMDKEYRPYPVVDTSVAIERIKQRLLP